MTNNGIDAIILTAEKSALFSQLYLFKKNITKKDYKAATLQSLRNRGTIWNRDDCQQNHYSIECQGFQLLWERRKCLTKIKKNNGETEYIYTPYITKKDGTRIYASQYGKKAFKIPKGVK